MKTADLDTKISVTIPPLKSIMYLSSGDFDYSDITYQTDGEVRRKYTLANPNNEIKIIKITMSKYIQYRARGRMDVIYFRHGVPELALI